MCGRYSTYNLEAFQANNMELTYQFKPVYNAAPTMKLPVVTNEKSHLIQPLIWGLIPPWSKDGKPTYSTINARSEDIFESKLYKMPLMKRHCLVLANKIYEWKKIDKKVKHPYMISPKDLSAFAFAGIWEIWKSKETGEEKNTFSIITTVPEGSIAHIHDRMPVILKPEDWSNWLDPALSDNNIKNLLVTYEGEMKAVRIQDTIGNVRNQDPCVMDLFTENPLSLF